MTLEDKIYQTLINNPDTYPIQQCGQIAEEFAIGFSEWCIESEGKDYNKYKYRNRKELLEIYKQEKGL